MSRFPDPEFGPEGRSLPPGGGVIVVLALGLMFSLGAVCGAAAVALVVLPGF